MSAAETVRVTTFVRVDAQTAFAVFTNETDLWWRQGPRFRFGGRERGVLQFEAGPGGRLFERFSDAPTPRTYEVGKVLAWEPGAHLRFEWRGTNFAADEKTEVDVRFEPAEGGTRVTLEHRGWEQLRADHPVRHGLTGPAFSWVFGLGWAALMTSWREHSDGKRTTPLS